MNRTWMRNLRIHKGLSVNDVANQMGMTSAMYYMIEKGQRWQALNLKQIQALSKVFKVSTAKIIRLESGVNEDVH